MQVSRRSLLALVPVSAAGVLAPAFAQTPAPAPAADPKTSERALGRADAPVTVQEFYSMTCSHCAEFFRDSLPRIRTELIDTGKVRLVLRDFPLDQVALRASMVARSLPPERYEPFVAMLLSTQDRWAFNRANDPREEIAKLAALAGMPRAEFDAAYEDRALAQFILDDQAAAQRQYNISSTPSFVIGGRVYPGALSFERFAELVAAATN